MSIEQGSVYDKNTFQAWFDENDSLSKCKSISFTFYEIRRDLKPIQDVFVRTNNKEDAAVADVETEEVEKAEDYSYKLSVTIEPDKNGYNFSVYHDKKGTSYRSSVSFNEYRRMERNKYKLYLDIMARYNNYYEG